MNNQDTTSPFKKDCPELELHSMLGDMKSLGVEFEKALDAEESEFNALADAAYRAKEQIREASRKTVVKVPKLVMSLAINPFTQLVEPYPIGTKIAAFFKSHEAHGLPKPKKGSRRAAPGRVYDGQVKGMEFDAYKLRMYVCEFNTPASNTLRLKESFVTPMVEAYQSEHEYVTSDGLSSPDTNLAMPNVSARICQQRLEANTIGKVKTVIVGSNLCRWFPGDELATWCDDSALSDATGGQWIEGTVVEIGKRNKKKIRWKKPIVALTRQFQGVYGFHFPKLSRWASATLTIRAWKEVRFMCFRKDSRLYHNNCARARNRNVQFKRPLRFQPGEACLEENQLHVAAMKMMVPVLSRYRHSGKSPKAAQTWTQMIAMSTHRLALTNQVLCL
jgi:hypothetical protein